MTGHQWPGTQVNLAVEVSTTPAFQAGTPRVLFHLPGDVQGNPDTRSVSRDGQLFALVVPAR